MKRHLSRVLLALSIGLLLSACNPGDSAPTTPTPTPTPTPKILSGYLTDIEGLSYSTPTQSGITGISGQFFYRENEVITFSLGEVVIGEPVTALPEMTLIDLVPNTPLYTTTAQIMRIDEKTTNLKDRLAFTKFSNIIWLLYSVDDDTNPDNGINIPTGISELLSGPIAKQLGFTEQYPSSKFKASLRFIKNSAVHMGLLNTGAVRLYGADLEAFYRNHQIDFTFTGVATETKDLGQADVASSITTNIYDEQGLLLTIALDDDSDGVADKKTTYTYNEWGLVLTETKTNDGRLGGFYEYTYDDNGNVLSYEQDQVGNGFPIYAYHKTYDDKGNNVWAQYDNTSSSGSTKRSSIYSYVYINNTNLTANKYKLADDGKKEGIISYTYNDNYNLLTYTNDYTADGTIDTSDAYTYDEQGNILTYRSNASIETYTYDDQGNKVKVAVDSDGDGTPDRTTSSTYDDNRNLLTEIHSISFGAGFRGWSYTYTYDEQGNRLTKSKDSIGDGVQYETETNRYSATGNLLTKTIDDNSDGTANSIETYTYDDLGNPLTYTDDSDGDGIADEVTVYTYTNRNLANIFVH